MTLWGKDYHWIHCSLPCISIAISFPMEWYLETEDDLKDRASWVKLCCSGRLCGVMISTSIRTECQLQGDHKRSDMGSGCIQLFIIAQQAAAVWFGVYCLYMYQLIYLIMLWRSHDSVNHLGGSHIPLSAMAAFVAFSTSVTTSISSVWI